MNPKQPNSSIKRILLIIKNYRRLILLCSIGIFGLGLLITFATLPLYTGTTKVMVEKIESNNLTGQAQGSRYDPEFYSTQFQLIKSRTVTERVVELLSLEQQLPAYQEKSEQRATALQKAWINLKAGLRDLLAKLKRPPEKEKGGANSKEIIRLAAQLSKDLKVRPLEGSKLVTISYDSPDPELAALVANTTAQAYIQKTLELKMNSSREALEWMKRKATSEKENLAKSEQSLQNYIGAKNLITMENRLSVTPKMLSEITTQLVRAQTERKELATLVGEIKRQRKRGTDLETLPAVAGDHTLQTLRSQIVAAEQRIRELGSKYGVMHPTMIKANNDLEILQEKKTQEIQRIVATIRTSYQLAQAKERNLKNQLKEGKAEAIRLNEQLIQYGALQREVDSNKKLYDALLMRIKERNITEENRAVDLWIVEQAAIPDRPAKPWVAVNLLLGLLLGLAGGFTLACILDYFDTSISSARQLEEQLGLPVLGMVTGAPGEQGELYHLIREQPLSPLAESYRGLRSSLLYATTGGAPKSILVTSSLSGEGKTTTAVNLAITMAQADQKVLLIDSDLRKPRIHKVLDIDNRQGLSSYLNGHSSRDLLWQSDIRGVTVLPAGPIPPNPAELLMSPRLAQLLDTLHHEFDLIICDSPPLLPVTDTLTLGQHFEGTLLIIQAHDTPHATADMAGRMLKESHAKVIGVVLNRLDLKRSDETRYRYEYYSSLEEEQPLTVVSSKESYQP